MSNEIPPLDTGPVSKTRRKKQMHELQDFGEMLLALPASTLAKLPLDERMRQAVAEWKKMRTWEAKRRHLQFIGRLLREGNGDDVRAACELLTNPSHITRLERQRDAMVANDDAVQAFIAAHPDVDVQHLRTLVRNARREREALAKAQENETPGDPLPKSANYQKLFQLLKELASD